MSYELTKDEIVLQISQVLRENDDLIEKLYEKLIGGTVYYVGENKFFVEEDEKDNDFSVQEDEEDFGMGEWDKTDNAW